MFGLGIVKDITYNEGEDGAIEANFESDDCPRHSVLLYTTSFMRKPTVMVAKTPKRPVSHHARSGTG